MCLEIIRKQHVTTTVWDYVARAFRIVGFPIFCVWFEGSTSV